MILIYKADANELNKQICGLGCPRMMFRGPALDLLGGAAFPGVGTGLFSSCYTSYSPVPAVGYGRL